MWCPWRDENIFSGGKYVKVSSDIYKLSFASYVPVIYFNVRGLIQAQAKFSISYFFFLSVIKWHI